MSISASYPIPRPMLDTIDRCAAGLGLLGVFSGPLGAGTDLAVIAPTWAAMVTALASQAGAHLDRDTAMKLTMVVATGAGTFFAGTKLASSILGWLLAIPSAGVSLVAMAAANAALNVKFTSAFGKATARYFLQADRIGASDVAFETIKALVAAELWPRRDD